MKKYTTSAKRSDNPQKWYVVDAKGAVLGRLATQVAQRLRGKHNPHFTPHVDTGDWVIVINADKITLSGRKMDQKVYYRHSGYIGGLKEITAKELLEKKPEPKSPLETAMVWTLSVSPCCSDCIHLISIPGGGSALTGSTTVKVLPG